MGFFFDDPEDYPKLSEEALDALIHNPNTGQTAPTTAVAQTEPKPTVVMPIAGAAQALGNENAGGPVGEYGDSAKSAPGAAAVADGDSAWPLYDPSLTKEQAQLLPIPERAVRWGYCSSSNLGCVDAGTCGASALGMPERCGWTGPEQNKPLCPKQKIQADRLHTAAIKQAAREEVRQRKQAEREAKAVERERRKQEREAELKLREATRATKQTQMRFIDVEVLKPTRGLSVPHGTFHTYADGARPFFEDLGPEPCYKKPSPYPEFVRVLLVQRKTGFDVYMQAFDLKRPSASSLRSRGPAAKPWVIAYPAAQSSLPMNVPFLSMLRYMLQDYMQLKLPGVCAAKERNPQENPSYTLHAGDWTNNVMHAVWERDCMQVYTGPLFAD